jgi:hypothetical protein
MMASWQVDGVFVLEELLLNAAILHAAFPKHCCEWLFYLRREYQLKWEKLNNGKVLLEFNQ